MLLKRAARAAGIEVEYSESERAFLRSRPVSCDRVKWNPLHNNGDALELAVFVGAGIDITNDAVCVTTGKTKNKKVVIKAGVGYELVPLTRLAIVQAAAALAE